LPWRKIRIACGALAAIEEMALEITRARPMRSPILRLD